MRRIMLLSLTFLISCIALGCNGDVNETTTASLTTTAVTTTGVDLSDFSFLTVKTINNKQKVVNADDKEIYMRGTNLGGWLVQEAWMTATNSPDQRTTIATLTERFGAQQCAELIDVWEDNWITTTDLDNIRAIGFNTVRVPFSYMNFLNSDNSWKENWFKRLDWVIEECSTRGIYVILDLHGAPGSQNGADHSGDISQCKLYESSTAGEANRALTVDIWEKLATRYKGNATVAAYDLINEPTNGGGLTTNVQWEFYDVLYDAVRAIDQDHIIMIEAVWDWYNLPAPSTYGWENIMYQYHQYRFAYSGEDDSVYSNGILQSNSMRDKVIASANSTHKVPTIMGEFNLFNNAMVGWRKGLYYLNAYNMHWTVWNWKMADRSKTNFWGVYNCTMNAVDINNDDYATIKSKWESTSTTSYKNNALYSVLFEFATGKNSL